MKSNKFRPFKAITKGFKILIASIYARMTFFFLFAISASNILAGGLITIMMNTPWGKRLHLNTITVVLIALGISYVTTVVASFFINRMFVRPMREVTNATKEIAAGNMDIQVNKSNYHLAIGTEIETLMDSFNTMATELKSTEVFRNDFIHNFSHEFKTPIISIRGFARQLQEGNLSKEQTIEYAKIIADESERLSNMSANVLLMSKLETQELITDKVAFSLDEQLRDCMLLYEGLWSEKNLSIEMDLDEITYFQSQDLLSHVWNNLIGNAIKFTPEGGFIHVKSHRGNGTVWVTVEDSGVGMDEETASHVFEKFYQGDKSHATAGNGLGLPLAKQIVTMLGGRITVQSKPGRGTTFAVSLPDNEESVS